MTAEGKNERISTPALSEIQAALKTYWTVLETSELSEASKGIYMDMAENFVRWLTGDFTPGSRKELYPVRKRRKDTIASYRGRLGQKTVVQSIAYFGGRIVPTKWRT
jgi:hypothetical protein